jgi:hypothetical protein
MPVITGPDHSKPPFKGHEVGQNPREITGAIGLKRYLKDPAMRGSAVHPRVSLYIEFPDNFAIPDS